MSGAVESCMKSVRSLSSSCEGFAWMRPITKSRWIRNSRAMSREGTACERKVPPHTGQKGTSVGFITLALCYKDEFPTKLSYYKRQHDFADSRVRFARYGRTPGLG